jgi:hypothetical protein
MCICSKASQTPSLGNGLQTALTPPAQLTGCNFVDPSVLFGATKFGNHMLRINARFLHGYLYMGKY